MTFEHARDTTRAMHEQGIIETCEAGALDGALDYHDVRPYYYATFDESRRQFASGIDNDIAVIARDAMINEIFGDNVEVFRRWLQQQAPELSDHSIDLDINEGNPFLRDHDVELCVPQPKHQRLLDWINSVDNEPFEDEKCRERVISMRGEGAALMVAIDNAFDAELTVLGHAGLNHVFGVRREAENKFYISDVLKDSNGTFVNFGPYTLIELGGFYDPDRPSEWPQIEISRKCFVSFENEEGVWGYRLRLYPPEPLPEEGGR